MFNNKCFIVAELSCNHENSFDIAERTLHAAKEAGANGFKLQTYTPDCMTLNCDNEYFKINNGSLWDGKTYYDLYKETQTPWEWFPKLKKIGDNIGIKVFSTPFSFKAVDYLLDHGCEIIKIASFEFIWTDLLYYINYRFKNIIGSTGIATSEEIDKFINIFRNKNVSILKCTSEYPAKIENSNLLNMVRLKDFFKDNNEFNYGLSDHTIGNDVSIAAVAMGAKVIERHFMLNENIKSHDNKFSLIPKQFKEMVNSIRNVELALGKKDIFLTNEQFGNRVFSRSIFCKTDIKKGERFNKQNLCVIRPGNGKHPVKFDNIINYGVAYRDYKAGEPLNFGNFDYF